MKINTLKGVMSIMLNCKTNTAEKALTKKEAGKNSRRGYVPDRNEVISFKEAYSKTFSIEYVNFLKDKIENGEIDVHIKSEFLKSPDKVKVKNASVRNIIFSRKSSCEFYADVIVSTQIELCETIANEKYRDSVVAWYRIRTESSLNPGTFSVNDLVSIVPYEKNASLPGIILDDCLVPYLAGELLEDDAKGILREYYPEALEGKEKTDGVVLAGRMGLNVMYVKLSDDSSVCGRFFFEDMMLSETGVKTGKLDVKILANTVAVDPLACMDEYGIVSREKLNSAIIHECIHAERHRLFYLGQKYFKGKIEMPALSTSSIQSAVNLSAYLDRKTVDECLFAQRDDNAKKEDGRTVVDWIEWQTDRMTPRTYMPEDVIRRKTETKKKEYRKKYPYVSDGFIAKKIISDLADEYGVSLQYAKNRLVELGYEEAMGVLNYADGKYLKDYKTGEGTLAPNQTYSAGIKTILSLYKSDEDFRELMRSGEYIYTDGHVCINNEKYVKTRKENVSLTEYAREHMDECCLVFTLLGGVNESGYIYGILGKDSLRTTATLSYDGKESKKGSLIAEASRLSAILYKLPASPSGTIKFHMKRKKVSSESLVSLSGVSSRTIERLRGDDCYKPNLKNVLAVCFGLHLEPKLTYDYLGKLGLVFTNRPEDLMYELLMNTMYKKSVGYINEILEQNGFSPLSKGVDELD